MKLLFKIVAILMVSYQSHGVIMDPGVELQCQAKNGWQVYSKELVPGTTRVPGNTLVYLINEKGEHLVTFSAFSESMGTEPPVGVFDKYELASVFGDDFGLLSFSWTNPLGCPRCSYPPEKLPSSIFIKTEFGSYSLICEASKL